MGERVRLEVVAALRWLGAPVTLACVALLALNDHLLKHLWPGVVTGKLSDVVGLVVAPPLVALGLSLLGVRRPATCALMMTGAVFAVVKTTVVGSELASAAWSAFAGPSYVRRDPTDLLALPALLVAARVRWLSRWAGTDRWRKVTTCAGALALPGALLVTSATGSCWTAHPGLVSVGAVTGRFSGAAGREGRIVFPGQFGRPTYSVDATGRVRELPAEDLTRLRGDSLDLAAACVRRQPRLCWRGAWRSGRTAVERSTDRGRTWTLDFVVAGREAAAVRRETGDLCSTGTALTSVTDVAAVQTGQGVLVAAAMRNAGVLVRLPGGSWQRIPVAELAETVPPAPSPAPGTAPGGRLRRVDAAAPQWPTPAPSPLPSPGPPCVSPTYVTVTPDPRNGPPLVRPKC